jgi:hypothetical protein
MEAWRDAAARLAALALAICSLRAADDFLAAAAAGDSVESAVKAVFVDVVEALDAKVPEREVADDVCEADDTFLEVSEAALLSRDDMDGFLNSPATGALARVGRAANVFAPYFSAGMPCVSLSGLGVFDRVMRGFPGDFRVPDIRSVPPRCGVFANGVWRDLMLSRPLDGVPSMVVRGLRYVLVEARKFGVLSSGPELELGLLFGLEDGLKENDPPALEPGRWLDPGRWLEPGRLEPGREDGLFFADSVSKNMDPLLFRAGDEGSWARVSIVLSDSDILVFNGRGLRALFPQSSSVALTGSSLSLSKLGSSGKLSGVLDVGVVDGGCPMELLILERPGVPPLVDL